MVKIQIETLGTENLIRSFTRIGQYLNDLSDPFRTIASHFWSINEENFQAEGKPERFKPLSPAYEQWKSKRYPGKKIMQLTGRLYESLTAENQADSQDTVFIVTKTFAELGTKVPYAEAHQNGSGHLPQRKVVQITDKHRVVWGRIVQRWAYGLFEKMGFETYYEEFGGVL